MSITVTIAQLRAIVERADIEEVAGTEEVEIDLPASDEIGATLDPEDEVRVVRKPARYEQLKANQHGDFIFAFYGDGAKVEPDE